MSTKFYTLLTEIGAAKLANATALGVPLKITQMAVGDGGGTLPTPSAQQTKLVGEKRRAALNQLYIDPQNASQIIAEQVIPENEGGWWIREVGLFDESGALIAVGNCAESYKPLLAEGSGRTQTVRMILITRSTDNITLKIDPSIVLATRKVVDDKVIELTAYIDDKLAKHVAAADPHTQYAPKVSPELTGVPKAPTAGAGANSKQIATTEFVQAALTALVDSSPAALHTLNELASALGNDPNFATTVTNALAAKQPLDKTLTALSGKGIGEIISYLGLGSAALKGVGSGAGQLPDMSLFGLSVSGAVSNRKLTASLPNGLTLKIVNGNADNNGWFDLTFDSPFAHEILFVWGTEREPGSNLQQTSTVAASLSQSSVNKVSGQMRSITTGVGALAGALTAFAIGR
ncbi:phage tail protein [Tatumella sp. TA1]|nr:phage tail protein [Tatumella sp. TA1]